MKYFIATLAFGAFASVPMTGHTMELSGETKINSPIYKPTKSAVKKTMEKLGYDVSYDEDGDIEFETKTGEWTSYIIFTHLESNGEIWNLQFLVEFVTKEDRYDDLLEYVNKRNAGYKYPKLSLPEKTTLRATINFPVEFGFNPDEFEENVLIMIENTLEEITDATDSMRE